MIKSIININNTVNFKNKTDPSRLLVTHKIPPKFRQNCNNLKTQKDFTQDWWSGWNLCSLTNKLHIWI